MMASRTMLKDAALSGMDPAAVLARVNRQLCENNPEMMFVTVWLGILEISTGKLVWADAGHERLCLFQNGSWECLPKKSSVALAAFEPEQLEDSVFRNCELQLRPGDVLFQYTDGVTEAMTEKRKQFGTERMMEALNAAPEVRPETLLPFMRERIDRFVCGAPQFDDITMLSLRYRGA
jgi:serine phosphatase RsbU (regulator of sigma subunit)